MERAEALREERKAQMRAREAVKAAGAGVGAGGAGSGSVGGAKENIHPPPVFGEPQRDRRAVAGMGGESEPEWFRSLSREGGERADSGRTAGLPGAPYSQDWAVEAGNWSFQEKPGQGVGYGRRGGGGQRFPPGGQPSIRGTWGAARH